MADQDNDEGEWTESGNRVRYYRFRNKLKEKAGGGARQDGYVDEAALKRAESTFKKASDQYPKLVESSVAALANACAQALAQPPDERGGEFKKLGIHFALVSPTFGFRGCDDRRLGPCRGPARAAPPAGAVGRKAGHEPANGGD